jgi:hypothetical protein
MNSHCNCCQLQAEPHARPPAAATTSAGLRQKIDACAYSTSLDEHLRDQVGIRHYADYLCLMHQIVRASIPLMEAAIKGCDLLDQTEARLAQYLAEHIKEERGHAELLLEDLEQAGMAPAQVLAMVPPAQVAQMVGAQYYWILHHSPLALLGYIAFLEGRPPSEQMIAFWQRATGLPTSAFRCLQLHADADPIHWRELDEFIDSLELGPEAIGLLGLSAMQSAQLAGDAWLSMARRWSTQ